jgi:SAM-dependent methyltransferase
MPILKSTNLEGFENPIALPESQEQARSWQEANQAWWESHPMRYDWTEQIGYPEFTKEFYLEIDRRFFADAEVYLPSSRIPFDRILDFESLRDKDVLEIGVGNGSHAGLLASYARSFTGIDLTDYAIKSTSERMHCFGLNARILQMDAEHMEFEDNQFDFIWTWGVIHHSSDTHQVLSEMRRVLRPGGRAVVMVYHRSFWHWYVVNGLLRGVALGQIRKSGSLHGTVQRWTDGAIARYYTIPEWKNLVSEFFVVDDVKVYGSKAEIIPLPAGRAKQAIMSITPNKISRLLANNLRMGGFLVSYLVKPT